MKKITNLFKFNINAKELFPYYVNKIYKYINADHIFFFFIFGMLLNTSLVRFLTVNNYFEIKPMVGDLVVILLIGAVSFLIKQRTKRFTYFIGWTLVITILCVINSIYYTFYNSFVSVSLISTSIFLMEVSDAVVQNVMSPKDAIYLWLPIAFFLIYAKKYKYNNNRVFKINYKKRMLNTLVVGVSLLFVFLMSFKPVEYSRLDKQWNREFLVSKFGLLIYHINDLIKTVEPRINTMFGYDKAVKLVNDFYEDKSKEVQVQNQYTNIFKGKNIIAIHAESMQSFAMKLKFNGVEVTPNLNRLASQGIYFSNFYTQVSVGTSSDTEFTINTSLLPVSNGTVFVSYWNRKFVTMPYLLKELGYYSFSMHANNGTFWNRLVMHKEMGYDKFFHKTSYVIDEEIGLGLSDKSFFKQSIPIIKDVYQTQNKPFYATMISLSNHTPFNEVDQYKDFFVDYKTVKTDEEGNQEEVSYPYMEGTTMGRYLKSVHYADEAIGEFILGLEEASLLDDTVIIIYGDHDARLARKDFIRLYNYDYMIDDILDEEDPLYKKVDYYQYELDRKVPFIIWTKDQQLQKKVNTVMGMYDVLPTLGNMFGFNSKYQLGHDIFSSKDNIVVFPNGNWLTNKVYYNSQKGEYLLLLDQQPLSEDYITTNNDYADQLLEVSNAIIMYDLVRKQEETNKLFQELVQ